MEITPKLHNLLLQVARLSTRSCPTFRRELLNLQIQVGQPFTASYARIKNGLPDLYKWVGQLLQTGCPTHVFGNCPPFLPVPISMQWGHRCRPNRLPRTSCYFLLPACLSIRTRLSAWRFSSRYLPGSRCLRGLYYGR